MNITVEYTAQLRHVAGKASETVDVSENASIIDTVKALIGLHGEEVRTVLMDGDALRTSTLCIVNGEQVMGDPVLKENDTLMFMMPIAGG